MGDAHEQLCEYSGRGSSNTLALIPPTGDLTSALERGHSSPGFSSESKNYIYSDDTDMDTKNDTRRWRKWCLSVCISIAAMFVIYAVIHIIWFRAPGHAAFAIIWIIAPVLIGVTVLVQFNWLLYGAIGLAMSQAIIFSLISCYCIIAVTRLDNAMRENKCDSRMHCLQRFYTLPFLDSRSDITVKEREAEAGLWLGGLILSALLYSFLTFFLVKLQTVRRKQLM